MSRPTEGRAPASPGVVAQPSWRWIGRHLAWLLPAKINRQDACATGSPESAFENKQLISDCDWRADANRLEEIFRHEFRHPDAAVGSGIAREISGMHSNSSMNAHKIGHRCALEVSPGRLRIDAQLDIWLYHIIGGINVIAVFARNMAHILLLNREMPDRSVQSFAPGG